MLELWGTNIIEIHCTVCDRYFIAYDHTTIECPYCGETEQEDRLRNYDWSR